MTTIRVDPSRLRDSAHAMARCKESVGAIQADALGLASGAPSYDGQFGPQVQAIGDEAVGRLRAVAAALEARRDFLMAKADAFEAADQDALAAFDRLGDGGGALLGQLRALMDHLLLTGGLALDQPFIDEVSMTELSLFFSQYENSDWIPEALREKFLTNPRMMAAQRAVILDLVEYIQDPANPPLTPEGFYDLVHERVSDPGTALLVCHNVLKAMARGTSPIGWSKLDDDPLTYSLEGHDGVFRFDTANLHPLADPLNHVGDPSTFYIMFSPEYLGKKDPGDWYHFFLEAAAAYYGAEGRADLGDFAESVLALGPGEQSLEEAVGVGLAVDRAYSQMFDPALMESNAYQGYRWANALSFLEGAVYGADFSVDRAEALAETLRESGIHHEGALFGLQLAGETPDPRWTWHVPVPGSIDLSEAQILLADVRGGDLRSAIDSLDIDALRFDVRSSEFRSAVLHPPGGLATPTPTPPTTPTPTPAPQPVPTPEATPWPQEARR